MNKKSSQISAYFMSALERGEFQVGDKLPTEAELAERYGCSRTTIREGLASLVHKGIFERRRGSGTFLASPVARKPKSKIIGAVVPVLSISRQPSIYQEIIRGIEDAAHQKGYSLMIGNSNHDPKKTKVYTSRFLENNVAGIIYAPMIVPDYNQCNNEIVEDIERKGIPLVIVDSLIGEDSICRFSFVGSNHFSAMTEVVKHLVSCGHSRIAFIRCFQGVWSADQHLAGFLHQLRLERLTVPNDYIIVIQYGSLDDLLHTQGRNEIRELLTSAPAPTAVVCTNDYTANNVISEAHEMGLRVPEDLAVVGFDDRPFAPYLNPPLTTVRQQFYEEGMMAFDLLEQKINDKSSGNQQHFLDCKLIVRKSCGASLKQQTGGRVVMDIANGTSSKKKANHKELCA